MCLVEAAKKCHDGDFTGILILRSVHVQTGESFEEYYIRADKAFVLYAQTERQNNCGFMKTARQ